MSNEDISIVKLDVEDILKDYNEIAPMISVALEHSSGEWTTLQVLQAAIADPANFHVWYVYDKGELVATASTRLVRYNNFIAIHIITLGGKTNDKLSEWTEEFVEQMREYPQVDVIEFTGRRGLLKPLVKAGWKERYTTVRYAMNDTINL